MPSSSHLRLIPLGMREGTEPSSLSVPPHNTITNLFTALGATRMELEHVGAGNRLCDRDLGLCASWEVQVTTLFLSKIHRRSHGLKRSLTCISYEVRVVLQLLRREHWAMRLRHLLYSLAYLALFFVIFRNLLIFLSGSTFQGTRRTNHCEKDSEHPIESFIQDANRTWSTSLGRRTHNVSEGAAAYRARRGRHPPPWFDRWYKKAQSLNVIIVEEYFDQIYHDLEPFWALNPAEIRASIDGWQTVAKVRNGRVVEIPQSRFRTRVWGDMLKNIAKNLPDMDLALNGLDEPRVLVPWEFIDETMIASDVRKENMLSLRKHIFVQDFPTQKQLPGTHSEKPTWLKKHDRFQQALRKSCSPDSRLRTTTESTKWHQANDTFVSNLTASKDICQNTDLFSQHGFLIEPATVDFTTSLVPVFSSSKLGVNNDILIPEPAYYSDNKLFSGRDWRGDWGSYFPWRSKTHGMVWRGAATGGHARTDTWRKFHRHRFVSRLNASNSELYDEDRETSTGVEQPIAPWLSQTTDVGFSKILCSGPQAEHVCPIMNQNYLAAPSIKMGQQFKWKYLPDIDGNTLSGRFRAFMRSNSAVMKSTIFTEWHDSRLSAWKHYIPLHISFDEIYDVLIYFLGLGNSCPHDKAGEKIASEGQKWANAVLRKEDMLVYMYRALLEYARIVHDERDHLGYVEDLLNSEKT